MLGVVYLLISFFFGYQLMRFLFPDPLRLFVGIAPKKSYASLFPAFLFYAPAGMIAGLVLVTFVTYWAAFFMTPFMPESTQVLYPANLVSLCLALYLGSLFWQKVFVRRNPSTSDPEEKSERRRMRSQRDDRKKAVIKAIPPLENRYEPKIGSVLFYVIAGLLFTVAATFLFYYSFHVSGDKIRAGFSVFSDLAPHTALISSFSVGGNYPTQYPHFPDGSIRYHFLFYFLCGNLNFLGFRLDHALNIPSVLSMVSCFLLLGVLAVLLFGRRIAFLIAPVLVLFRSSLAGFEHLADLIAKSGTVTPNEVATLPAFVTSSRFFITVQRFFDSREWIGSTPYDNWGLWAVNVYANQRHLLLGVGVVLILIFLFLPHVRRMFLHMRRETSFRAKAKHFFLSREAWIHRKNDPLHPVALTVLATALVITMPYFHGSALVTGLLVLAFLAIFSENRLAYLVVAAASVVSALIQTTVFSGGAKNVVSPAFHWGFIVNDPTLWHVAVYLLQVTGIAAVLIFILLFVQRSLYRTVTLLAFSVPAVFAFLVSMTIDVTSNHKFIQITLILYSVYLAGLLAALWAPAKKRLSPAVAVSGDDAPAVTASLTDVPETRGRRISRAARTTGKRILATVLFCCLILTGVNEWIVYRNINQNAVEMDLNSAVVDWIKANTPTKSVFLTASFAMNSFFLSGRFAYYGHPYYAWSAGYDTESRMKIYADLLTGCGGDVDRFRTLCHEQGITYVLMDNDMLSQADFPVDVTFFAENLTVAASFPDNNNTVIYRVS